jgi:hypothetical protein
MPNTIFGRQEADELGKREKGMAGNHSRDLGMPLKKNRTLLPARPHEPPICLHIFQQILHVFMHIKSRTLRAKTSSSIANWVFAPGQQQKGSLDKFTLFSSTCCSEKCPNAQNLNAFANLNVNAKTQKLLKRASFWFMKESFGSFMVTFFRHFYVQVIL